MIVSPWTEFASLRAEGRADLGPWETLSLPENTVPLQTRNTGSCCDRQTLLHARTGLNGMARTAPGRDQRSATRERLTSDRGD